jgi:2-oxo-4-hydroxy-4-carboxy--5-ureidoimidazoline (OHCU) decarboxylase
MREIEQRSGNARDEEISNGLAQVGHIALARLQKLIVS